MSFNYVMSFLRYEILVPNDTLQFGLPRNESWSGVLGLLDRKVSLNIK